MKKYFPPWHPVLEIKGRFLPPSHGAILTPAHGIFSDEVYVNFFVHLKNTQLRATPAGIRTYNIWLLGNALQIFAKSRNLAEFTSDSAKFRRFEYQIRMFAYWSREFTLNLYQSASLRIEAVSLLSIHTKRKTGKHAAWNSKLTYLT